MPKPWMSELIMKKLGIHKCNGSFETATEDLSMAHAVEVAKEKANDITGADLKAKTKEVIGTCVSMRVRVEGRWGKEACKAIDDGEFDEHF